MTDEDDIGLDSHDHDHDYDPKTHRHRRDHRHWRILTLPSYINLLVRYSKSHHEVVYLLILPALYFRFFPFILTHNSTPLSVYLAVVLVYIPVKVVQLAWEVYSPSSHIGDGWKRRSGIMLPLNGSPASSNPSPTLSRSSRVEKGQGTTKSFLWLCGAVFSLWVYTWGISSPFPTASSIISSSPTLRAQQARNASYFIAVSFWNNEDILDAWAAETLKLIDALGRSNVYVSITENDSEDNTASRLLHFGRELTRRNVTHSVNITTDIRGYPTEDPWRDIRHRMEYMTNLRNGALEPLKRLNRRFENVVFMNDVMYHHTDVLKLIAAVGGDDVSEDHYKYDHTGTRVFGGRHQTGKPVRRRMACGVDMDGASLYDSWVLRDRCGGPVSGFWPFFSSSEDRKSVRKGRVLEVSTCWNGIVVLDGDMLVDSRFRSKKADWDADTLRFQKPPGCIISECALLPVAITNVTGGAPVVVDPTVVVGYTVKWWRYYAVWLRMPVVRLWMRVFEEKYWAFWWKMGMGKDLRWTGLDDGKEKGECVIEGWPKCGSRDIIEKGAIRLRNQTREL